MTILKRPSGRFFYVLSNAASRTSKPAVVFGLICMTTAWILPNHYYPWPAFEADWLTAAGFIIISLATIKFTGHVRFPKAAVAILGVALVPLAQFSAKIIFYFGDAAIASLYLIGLSLSIICGFNATKGLGHKRLALWFSLSVMLGTILSTILAACQWLRIDALGFWLAPMVGDAIPAANLAQHNQFASLLIWGLIATFYLNNRKVFTTFSTALIGSLLCVGIASSQSRSGLLQAGVLAVLALWFRWRTDFRFSPTALLICIAILFTFAISWSSLTDLLLLNTGRTLGDQMSVGTRPTHWASLIAALVKQPWFGYGWNQVSVAQAAVANAFPPTREMIEHSHNLLIDFIVWNGLPAGLFLIVLFFTWLLRRLINCHTAEGAAALMGICTMLTHSMLEFPLEYAYFLLPFGFLVGTTEYCAMKGRRAIECSNYIFMGLLIIAIAGLVEITVEYPKAEENLRSLRFESLKIGTATVTTKAPSFGMLTQLHSFLSFARNEARPGMSDQSIDAMRKVALRYGYAPVLFRYALASGLNHRPEEARATLIRLCKTQPFEICQEGAENWKQLSLTRFPVLAGIEYPAVSAYKAAPANR